jgi:hypothetical protein
MYAQRDISRNRGATGQRRSRADDLEFSDYGRDPRIGAGWYILPRLAMGVMLVGISTFVL